MASQAERYAHMIDQEIFKTVGAIPLVLPILETLGVRELVRRFVVSVNEVDHGTVALVLCLNRLVAPKPLYQVEHWLADTILPEVLGIEAHKCHDDRLGRFLDDLAPQIEPIWQELCLRALQHYRVDLSVLLYDLTSIAFTGDYADNPAVTYGYSRDHRPDLKQRVVGLDITGLDGVPLLYQLLAGNTADCTTPEGNLSRLRTFLDRLPEPPRWSVLVCDRALISEELLVRSFRQQVHLLGPLDDRSEAHRQVLRGVSAAELHQHPLPYRPKRAKPTDPTPYFGIARRTTFTAEIDGQTVGVPGQVLIVLSESKARLDQQYRQAERTKLEQALATLAGRLNQRKFKRRDYVVQRLAEIQRGNPTKRLLDLELVGEDGNLTLTYTVNADKLAQAEALDGKYLLATTDLRLSATELLERSKLRDGIEKRIGLFKGPLQVHPLYVQTEPRIQGLVFLTLIALLVFSLLELQLRRAGQPQTARSVVDRFSGLRAVYLLFRDGSTLRRVAEPNQFQAQMLAILGFPSPQAYLAINYQGADT